MSKQLSGIETLRRARALFDGCNETFNEQFSVLQLIKLYEAYNASGWTITPDQWNARQVKEALEGHAPQWTPDEPRAIYADGSESLEHDAMLCDGCGTLVKHDDRYTDDAVCGATDGPGFYVCDSCATSTAVDLTVDERRAHYTAQRALNTKRLEGEQRYV